MMESLKRYLPELVLCGCCIIGASTYIIGKYLFQEISAADAVCLRFTIGVFVLIPFVWKRLLRELSWELIVQGALLGLLFSFSVFQLWKGLQKAPSGVSAFIGNAEFLLVPWFDRLIFRNRIERGTLFLSFVGLIGTGCLSLSGTLEPSPGAVPLLLSLVGFSLYLVFVSKLARQHSPILFTFVILFFGALASSVPTLEHGGPRIPTSLLGMSFLLYLGIVATSLRWAALTWSQSKLSASHASLLYLAEPLAAVFMGMIFLSERPSLQQVFGMSLLSLTLLATFQQSAKRRAKKFEGVSNG